MPNRQKAKAEKKHEAQKLRRETTARAVSPRLRMSATKVRRVADLVRGLPVQQALWTCDFLPHRAAPYLKKTIHEAVANAEESSGMDAEALVVSHVHVDEGFTIPRIRPRAQGRAYRIRRRTCTLTIEVAESEEE